MMWVNVKGISWSIFCFWLNSFMLKFIIYFNTIKTNNKLNIYITKIFDCFRFQWNFFFEYFMYSFFIWFNLFLKYLIIINISQINYYMHIIKDFKLNQNNKLKFYLFLNKYRQIILAENKFFINTYSEWYMFWRYNKYLNLLFFWNIINRKLINSLFYPNTVQIVGLFSLNKFFLNTSLYKNQYLDWKRKEKNLYWKRNKVYYKVQNWWDKYLTEVKLRTIELLYLNLNITNLIYVWINIVFSKNKIYVHINLEDYKINFVLVLYYSWSILNKKSFQEFFSKIYLYIINQLNLLVELKFIFVIQYYNFDYKTYSLLRYFCTKNLKNLKIKNNYEILFNIIESKAHNGCRGRKLKGH